MAHLQVADAGNGPCGNGRRQRGGENESRSVGADGVTEVAARGDVPAHDAEALGERAVDDVDAAHDSVTLGKSAGTGSVEPDGVHFVEVGEGAVFSCQIAD